MAKQIAGLCRLEGTFDDITFYKMQGNYYAGLLGRASKIGSVIYRQLPEDWRQFWMYRSFTGEAMKMLEGGATDQEATDYLWNTYVAYWEVEESPKDRKSESPEAGKEELYVARKRKPNRRAGLKKQPKGSPRRNYKRPVWIDVAEAERKRLAYEKKKTWCKQQWQKERQEKAMRLRVRLTGCPEIRRLIFDIGGVIYLSRLGVTG